MRGAADGPFAAGALLGVAVGLTALPFYMLQRNLDIAGIQPRYFIGLVPLLLALAALLGCFGAPASHPHATEEHAK